MLCSTACTPGIWGEGRSLVWSLESLSDAFRAIYLQNLIHTPSEPFCPDVPAHNQLGSSVWSLLLGCVYLGAIRLSNWPLLDPVTHHPSLQPLSCRTSICLPVLSVRLNPVGAGRSRLLPIWAPVPMRAEISGANSSKSRAQQGHWSVSSVFKDQLISVLPSWTHTKKNIVRLSPFFFSKSGWFCTLSRHLSDILGAERWEEVSALRIGLGNDRAEVSPGARAATPRRKPCCVQRYGQEVKWTPGSSETGGLF